MSFHEIIFDLMVFCPSLYLQDWRLQYSTNAIYQAECKSMLNSGRLHTTCAQVLYNKCYLQSICHVMCCFKVFMCVQSFLYLCKKLLLNDRQRQFLEYVYTLIYIQWLNKVKIKLTFKFNDKMEVTFMN
jgi:hypothetical protein